MFDEQESDSYPGKPQDSGHVGGRHRIPQARHKVRSGQTPSFEDRFQQGRQVSPVIKPDSSQVSISST